jgi:hypothetical protein
MPELFPILLMHHMNKVLIYQVPDLSGLSEETIIAKHVTPPAGHFDKQPLNLLLKGEVRPSKSLLIGRCNQSPGLVIDS